MATAVEIRYETVQHIFIKELHIQLASLSSVEIKKYEFLTGEEVLPPQQNRIIDQDRFIYYVLQKAVEKQIKIIGDQ